MMDGDAGGAHGGLPADVRALVRLSAALALGDEAVLDDALDGALAVADAEEVEEALLQSYLFLGYPVALNALARWRERSGRPAPEPAAEDWDMWARRGQDVCATVYGGQYLRLRQNVRRLHPDLETWMVVEGYGKVLGRPGLSLDRRELCVVAILAVAGPLQHRQLYAHLRGALNAGLAGTVVQAALEEALALAPAPARAGARQVWDRVRERTP